ncbi:MAG: thioredoxin-disulfide reductase [Sandaracinaceae bacterium]|nr:thioredoxin-disulfide reductase [Sandaracinaceae bacterium]
MPMSSVRNVVIIGSGPAGLTAAIYAARANLKPVCVEGFSVGGIAGGQLMITSTVENYPGFPEGITGPDLMAKWKAQAERFGTEIVSSDVVKVDFSKRPYKVVCEDGKEIFSNAVIISTGAKAKWLHVPGEKELESKGVSACATCDGYFFRNQDVCVVGGGDTAMEEALYLAGLCKSVTVIHRRQEFRASRIMIERAQKHPKIKWMLDCAVTAVRSQGEGHQEQIAAIEVQNLRTGEKIVHPTQGLFVAIGHEPNTQLFKGILDMEETGYLKTVPGTTRTNIEGVFASGDVQDHVYRQAVTAAGTGCMAAIECERWLAANDLLVH